MLAIHSELELNIKLCCLLRRFNHNYYASNHHIAEDHFPIFVRRVIQMAKVIARRPKLFMNKSLVIFQKSPSQNARLSRESNQVLLDASLTSYQLSYQSHITSCENFNYYLTSLICYLLPINSNLILVYHRITTI